MTVRAALDVAARAGDPADLVTGTMSVLAVLNTNWPCRRFWWHGIGGDARDGLSEHVAAWGCRKHVEHQHVAAHRGARRRTGGPGVALVDVGELAVGGEHQALLQVARRSFKYCCWTRLVASTTSRFAGAVEHDGPLAVGGTRGRGPGGDVAEGPVVGGDAHGRGVGGEPASKVPSPWKIEIVGNTVVLNASTGCGVSTASIRWGTHSRPWSPGAPPRRRGRAPARWRAWRSTPALVGDGQRGDDLQRGGSSAET